MNKSINHSSFLIIFLIQCHKGPLYRRPGNRDMRMRKKCFYRLLVSVVANSRNICEYIIILRCGIMYDLFSKFYCK